MILNHKVHKFTDRGRPNREYFHIIPMVEITKILHEHQSKYPNFIAKPRMCPRRFTKTPGVLANRLENTHRSSRHIRCFQDTCQDAKVPPQDTFSRHLFKTPVKRHSKNLLDTAKKHKCFSRHLGEFSRDTQMCLEKHKGVLKRCLENFTCVLKAKKLTS